MRKKYDLVVSTGSYESRGETKKKWLTIGSVMEGEKGPFVFLEPWVNLAAIPRQGDSIMVSCFEPKKDKNEGVPF